jgi:hypothetical protein
MLMEKRLNIHWRWFVPVCSKHHVQGQLWKLGSGTWTWIWMIWIDLGLPLVRCVWSLRCGNGNSRLNGHLLNPQRRCFCLDDGDICVALLRPLKINAEPQKMNFNFDHFTNPWDLFPFHGAARTFMNLLYGTISKLACSNATNVPQPSPIPMISC